MNGSGSAWVVRSGRGEPRLRLLCFPYAGGGASSFRGWADQLPAHVEVCALQLPGRETRLKEQPLARLPDLIAALVAETRAYRQCAYAFFGHSLGGLIAFELTRALRRRGERLPLQLFVSACGAPQLPEAERLRRIRQRQGGVSIDDALDLYAAALGQDAAVAARIQRLERVQAEAADVSE